ncbi:MAG: Gfo/Idh/MocA family oxidoreductase [candidate division Zixibacteria bacterium]|nr:Gfo/Idh/MocA family oxidoreductase [candidate division Zixibacteria bacterium]
MAVKLRYGVIGCGHLGRFHVQKAAALDNVELVGLFDIDGEKGRSAADANQTHAFAEVEELLAEVDAVSIVVPTETHHQEGMRALEAGKHVLLEKPIAVSVSEGEELTNLAARQDVKLQIGHIERFNPACAGLRLLPETPRFIEGHRLSQFNPRGLDVAVIFDLMIHDIDLILSLVDAEVTEVHASAVAVISDKPDIANARLRFANGTVANLTASRISVQKMRKLRLFARDNYVSIDFLQKKGEHFLLAETDATDIPDGYFSAAEYAPTGRRILFGALSYPDCDMLTEEIKSFVDAVQNDRPVVVSGREATAALKVALQIEKSAREGLDRVVT